MEEMKAWKKRSDNMRRIMTELETKVGELADANMELLKFHAENKELQHEEVILLREETRKADVFWTDKKRVL